MTPLYYALDYLYRNDPANYEIFYEEVAYLSALHRQINVTHDNIKTLTPETLFLLQADHGTLEKVIPVCMNQFPYQVTNLHWPEVAPPLDLHATTLNLRDYWNSFILKLALCLFSYQGYFTPEHFSDTFGQLNIYSLSLLSGLAPRHHLLMKTILDEIAQIKLTSAIEVFCLVGSQTLITREDSLEKRAYHPDNLNIPEHVSTAELSAWQNIADLDVRGIDPTLHISKNWDTAFNALKKIGNNLGIAAPQIDKNPQYPSLTLRTQTPKGKFDFTITGRPSLGATNTSFAIALTGPQKGLVQCVDPFMLLSILSRKVTSPYLTSLYSRVQNGQLNIYHPEFRSSMVFFLKSMAQTTVTKYSLSAEQLAESKYLLSATPPIISSIFKTYQDKVIKENSQYEKWLLNFFQQSFDKEFNAYLLAQWENTANPVVAPSIELPTAAAQEKIAEEEAAREKAEATAAAQKERVNEAARKKAAEKETARKHAEQEQQRKLEDQVEQRRLKALEKQKTREEQERREAKAAEERIMVEIQRKSALLEERKAADALLAQWKAEKKGRKKSDADIIPAPASASALTEITAIDKMDVSANTSVLREEAPSTSKTDTPKMTIPSVAEIGSNKVPSLKAERSNKTKSYTNTPAKTSTNKSTTKKNDAPPVVAAKAPSTTYWGQMSRWVTQDLRAASPADLRFTIASLVSTTVVSLIFHTQYNVDRQERATPVQQAPASTVAQATSANNNPTHDAIMVSVSLLFTVLLALKMLFPKHMPSPTRLILNAVFPERRMMSGITTLEANNPRTLVDENTHEKDESNRHPRKQKGRK